MTIEKEQADQLIDFLHSNPTPGYFVSNTSSLLKKSGFQALDLNEHWDTLSPGRNYYVNKDDAAIFAFKIPCAGFANGFKIVGAHVDSPGIKIKPNPEVLKDGYLQLNTEVYGGPILSTWFDRPLCAAGKIYCKGKDPFSPLCQLINIDRPIALIPNLAIHMNRKVNLKYSIDNQKHLLPVLKTVFDKNFSKDNVLLHLISEESGIDVKDILDFELTLYDHSKGCVFGLDNEFISSSRLDDQQSAYAGITALTENKSLNAINMVACFDNEEVGSATKQGADSQVLSNLLERIILSLDGTREDFLVSIARSFFISSDGAHSVHPNYGEKSDISNRPMINKGPVIKISANQKYTSDAETTSIIKGIADKEGIPLQCFVNHSNERGGSTIGPLSSTHLDMKAIDLGVAMLGMHSIRETIGIKDHLYLTNLLKAFFKY